MEHATLFQVLANATLVLHAALVMFVVLGLPLIVAGSCLKWGWVGNRWFRLSHLGAIGLVVAESWLGIDCPLTTLESWLRDLAGQVVYNDGFIAFWLRRLIFFEAPAWVFTVGYSAFGVLVILSWWFFPPKPTARECPPPAG